MVIHLLKENMNKLIDIIGWFYEPVIDFVNSWMTTVVSLNAQGTFKADKKGHYKQQSGSAVIVVINNSRNPLKVDDIGLIFKDGRKLSVTHDLTEEVLFPKVVDGKDHAFFTIKRDLLTKLGHSGLYAIKSVYITDATFRDFKSRVPEQHKRQIEASYNNLIVVK